MHMADALLSPAVGATMWAGSLTVLGYSSRKLKENIDNKTIPLMGVMGAFIFAAQMINFTIPGTGSSGHLGGGMLLAIILGPYAAFLVMASVLTVQALFFADGGLLALGCNIWNLGIYPCFIAYPLIYKTIAGNGTSTQRLSFAAIVGALLALQLGSFSVVLETLLSGKSELPFATFAILMQPIHLAIGLVEGIVTAGIISYVKNARPEILESSEVSRTLTVGTPVKNILITFVIMAIISGGTLSWLASTNPDGLEWSIEKVIGKEELAGQEKGIPPVLKEIQEKTAFLPDYNFKQAAKKKPAAGKDPVWPRIDAGTSFAGVVGGAIVLGLVVLIGFGIRNFKKR
ncbi:MAG: energy-coupling factor ABC transporter permease [Smithellaceae bacterium]